MKNLIYIVIALILAGAGFFFWQQKTGGSMMKQSAPVTPTFKIGVIYKGENFKQIVDGFQEGLANAIGQKSYRIEYVVEEVGGTEQVDFDVAAERLVTAKVDLILAVAVESVIAAKKATSVDKIPVLLVIGSSPVTLGLVANLQHPGDNITGVVLQIEELVGKRLELLKQIDPRIKSIVIFKKKGTQTIENSLITVREVAKNLGIRVTVKEVDTREEFDAALSKISRPEFDSIFYAADPFIARNADILNKRMFATKMASVAPDESVVRRGMLASYGSSFPGAGEQVSRLAKKILVDKQPPGELPVESVYKIDFSINLEAAKRIGIEIPPEMISLAQIVIR